MIACSEVFSVYPSYDMFLFLSSAEDSDEMRMKYEIEKDKAEWRSKRNEREAGYDDSV